MEVLLVFALTGQHTVYTIFCLVLEDFKRNWDTRHCINTRIYCHSPTQPNYSLECKGNLLDNPYSSHRQIRGF